MLYSIGLSKRILEISSDTNYSSLVQVSNEKLICPVSIIRIFLESYLEYFKTLSECKINTEDQEIIFKELTDTKHVILDLSW